MPLKPRSRVLSGASESTVTSRDRPGTGPSAEELAEKTKRLAPDDDGDELSGQGTNDAPIDITDDGDEELGAADPDNALGADPGLEVGGTQHKGETPPPPNRRGRPPRTPAAAGEGHADPKGRMSEISREVKQLRSDYTAEVKRIEADYGERLKALRTEYDVLNAQVVEQAFTL